MPDNLIQVGAVVDLGAYKTGMAEAAATTERTMSEVSASFEKHSERSQEAMHAMGLSAEATGITINRHLRTVLNEIPLLSTAFEFAFPVFAGLAMIDLLSKIPEHISKWVDSLGEVTEAEKTRHAEAVKNADEELKHQSKLIKAQYDLQIASAEGEIAKQTLRVQLAGAMLGLEQGRVASLQKEQAALQGLLDKQKEQTKLLEGSDANAEQTAGVWIAISQKKEGAYDKEIAAANRAMEEAKADADEALAHEITAEHALTDDVAKEAKRRADERAKELKQFLEAQKLMQNAQAELAKSQERLDLEMFRAQRTANDENIKQAIAGVERLVKAKLKAAEEQHRAFNTEIEAARAHEAALGQLAEQRLGFELEIGKISQKEYEKQLQAELGATYANERQKLELKRKAAEGNIVEQAKVDAQLQALDDKYYAASEKAEQQSFLRRRKTFDQYFQTLSGTFNAEINSWIQGTETAGQAFTKMFDSIIGDLVGFVEKWIEHKIEMWLMDRILGESAQITQTATHNAGNAVMAQSDAFLAAANALATVPYPANIPASTEMLGLGTSFAISAASFDIGTNFVPQSGLAFLHRGEQVIPASQQGPGFSGHAIHVHVGINAVDAPSFDGMLRRHGHMIGEHVSRALKKKGIR